jgi:23S rRNA (cytosine1962-C5)-methyltransferase
LNKPKKDKLSKLRHGLDQKTNIYRLIHGAADGWKGLYVDRLGDYLLIQSSQSLNEKQKEAIQLLQYKLQLKGVYFKRLNRRIQKASNEDSAPQLIAGVKASQSFEATELSVHYQLSFNQGYSSGLFLDMRDNRQRLLTNLVKPGFSIFDRASGTPSVLNTFSYTCSLSVCAAKTGATTTSIDLSKKYLDWGRKNFQLNNINPNDHDFIYGDTFDWMKRLKKKGKLYDLVILDPPTFSRSKTSGLFQAKQHYEILAKAASHLVQQNGIILACCNASTLSLSNFKSNVSQGIHRGGRKIIQSVHAAQPLDFPSTSQEPAYLKAYWLRLN